MYIMFPIGIMYYFGTNLDEKFSVPDFWPKREETHKIPYDRKEIEEELERLKARRLAARARRLEFEGGGEAAGGRPEQSSPSPLLQSLQHQQQQGQAQAQQSTGSGQANGQGWFSWLK